MPEYAITFTLDALGGVDSIDFGTELRSRYAFTLMSDGAIKVDSISGASPVHATLYNVELLYFQSQKVVVDLRTYFADLIAPTVSSFNPASQAIGVTPGSNLIATFSETVVRGAGNISLTLADGTVVAVYDAASSNVTISDNTVTVNPSADLNYASGYKLVFDAGSLKDAAGNNYAGTSSYSFTTGSPPVVNGGIGNDVLAGTVGNDTINGADGNDTITGGVGNDNLNGGNGIDTAVFSGKLADYTLTRTGTAYQVRDNRGTDGTDFLTNVESLKFSDYNVNLSVQAKAAAAPAADVQRLMELYVAFFNRIPDGDGMAYWVDQFTGGQSTRQIAETFYGVGVQYASLTGFSASMTTADFINVVYKNVLGRPDGADAGGMKYWTDLLTAGTETRGSLVSNILGAAHAYKGDATWGWVANLLDNKVAVAKSFSIDMGLSFTTADASITQGMAISHAITATDTSAALTLIGLSPLNIVLG